MGTAEAQTEEELIEKLVNVNCEYRRKIRDRTSLEKNVRDKVKTLDHLALTDGEVQWLLDAVVIADLFTASRTLGTIKNVTRDDGRPPNYTLVNIKDRCNNAFGVVNHRKINTGNSHHRYDVILLTNGVPAVQTQFNTSASISTWRWSISSTTRPMPVTATPPVHWRNSCS